MEVAKTVFSMCFAKFCVFDITIVLFFKRDLVVLTGFTYSAAGWVKNQSLLRSRGLSAGRAVSRLTKHLWIEVKLQFSKAITREDQDKTSSSFLDSGRSHLFGALRLRGTSNLICSELNGD